MKYEIYNIIQKLCIIYNRNPFEINKIISVVETMTDRFFFSHIHIFNITIYNF